MQLIQSGLKTILVAALLLTTSSSIAGDLPTPSTINVISGLGERHPATKDFSASANFHVYKFNKDGITYVQVNTLDDRVLAAVAFANRSSFALPIGSLSSSQIHLASSMSSATASATSGAKCPCSAEVVYSGTDGRIVVVYGSDGTVIEVVVLNNNNQSK